ATDADGEPMVIEHSGGEQDRSTVEQVQQDAGQRIDWDADLKRLEGNHDGLRKLWSLAAQYPPSVLPDGFMQRLADAGERAKQQTASDQSEGVVDAEVVSDDDAPLCSGSTIDPDERGSMVITDPEGREVVFCEDCDQQVRVHNGLVLPHGNPNQ